MVQTGPEQLTKTWAALPWVRDVATIQAGRHAQGKIQGLCGGSEPHIPSRWSFLGTKLIFCPYSGSLRASCGISGLGGGITSVLSCGGGKSVFLLEPPLLSVCSVSLLRVNLISSYLELLPSLTYHPVGL